MSKIRVHELAARIGRQNREVIEALKEKGVEVKSHMSSLDEASVAYINQKFLHRGKEQITKVDNSRTEEKMVTAKPEAEKAEAPKKKKNIIRVYHAQNASDGGKNRPKRQAQDKKPGARGPQAAKAPRNTEAAPKKPAEAVKRQPEAPAAKPAEQTKAPETKSQETAAQNQGKNRPSQEQAGAGRNQNRQPRERREGSRDNNRDGRDRSRDFRGGDRRPSDNRGQGRPQGGGQGRPARNNDGRPVRNGEGGNRPVRGGQGGRPSDNRGQGRPQGGGQGRPDGNNRFGGGNRSGQRPGGRRNDGDAVFTPELTKTSKDSKRERDRENKNKKKDFDKSQGGGHRPNQGGRRNMSRLPKALQKPAPQPKQEEKKPEIKEITLPEKMTIRELAEAMKMQPSVIAKKLFMEGTMVTVNHEIDFEKAQEIALGYDIIAEPEEKVDVIGELLKEEEEDEADMVSRPPVVCVMGHVDHGKTSLLDAIRNTNVTRGEAGGITQHIGAYVVENSGQKITFLDTPGHEAFTAMRMRGANSTDIAILVVAADDGVMPQTIEAINHAKAAGIEIIVAINKIDKPSANIERVKQELTEYELIPEDWGGSTIFVPVSAHTKEGIQELLEMVLLTAEVMELKANPNRVARGLVIEAELDKGKGSVATVLVQKGTLRVGDAIAAGSAHGKVRAMMDDRGRRVKEAGPSQPVEILGLNEVPQAGEVFVGCESEKEARNFAETFISQHRVKMLEETKSKMSLDDLFNQIQEGNLKELNIVVKADVQGSVEAIKQSLIKLSNEEVVIKIIHGGVGAINESDVILASASNAIIIGFNVRPDATAKEIADREGVDLRLYRVIYNAIEDVEAAMKGMLDPVFEEKVLGHAEVRQTFKASGVGTIAGSYVQDGTFERNCSVRLTRDGIVIFDGPLASLKRFKDDVKEVRAGYECGFVFENYNDIKEGDLVEAYKMVEIERK